MVFEVIIKERKGGERESWASGSRIAGQCQQQLCEWMQEAKRRGDSHGVNRNRQGNGTWIDIKLLCATLINLTA